MIYTVTFNPSLDYIVGVNDFNIGNINRTTSEHILPGGKGINVSIVLNNLGIDSVALGFLAGFTGEQIKALLIEQGITSEFIKVQQGISRINVKIKSQLESEINGRGPEIAKEELDLLFEQLNKLKNGDWLVLAGSIPSMLPYDIYQKMMMMVADREIKIIVDATKELLVNVLRFHPFLIKPNHYELGELFGVAIHQKEEAVKYAKELQTMGARNVLVSMAADGAVFVTEGGDVYQAQAPKGQVVNSVGAGDSMVAGFMAGYLTTGSFELAFRMGIAAGSASAFSKDLATKAQVEELLYIMEQC